MFRRHLNPFYSPEDSNTTATIESGKLSVSDMVDELGKDETPDEEEIKLEEDKKTGEEDTESDEQKDEEDKSLEDELEDELEEEDKLKEEDDDEVVVHVSRKEILAKYPNLFKDFPQINKAIYREQAYSEIVPTLEDAREAVRKSEILDRFGEELSEGQTTTILKAVKEESQEAFHSLVDNYLGNLQQVDENAYFHVLGNVIKHTIVAMVNSKNEDLQNAAALLNKFVFRSDDFVPPSRLSKTEVKDEKEAKLEKREQEFREQQLNTHVNSINTRVENSVKSSIDKYIDPKESMTPYVRRQAIRDCTEELEKQIEKDTRFHGILDKLWEKAAESDFSSESLDKIRLAYLSKAKNLLPTIIKKVRNEALKGPGKRVLDSDDDDGRRRGPLPVGRDRRTTPNTQSRASSGNSDKDKARALPKGMKSIDYLLRD